MSDWTAPDEPRMLAGDNPQVPKGDGGAPVAYYIEHMPEWKQPIGRRIDELIREVVPDVHRKVRWNQPFYGIDPDTVFVSFRCFARKVQLAFHNGAALDPPPPKDSKHPDMRYLDITEDDDLDEARLRSWFTQASRLPGERL